MKIMNFVKNIGRAVIGLLAFSLAVTACTEEEIGEARAVLTDVSYLTFEAQDAPEQTVNVSSDGDWVADVSVDWITVTPMSGRGNVTVTFAVNDNVKDGALDAPRKGTVIFRGSSVERQGQVTVNQKGDTYLGVVEATVTEVAEYEDEQPAKIAGAQVVAVANDGFVITDGTTAMFVSSTSAVAVGDKVFLNGTKTTYNDFPSFIGDEVQILSNDEIEHPEALDLTTQVDSYEASVIQYVTVEGTLVGTAVKNIAGAPSKAVNILSAPESVGLDAVAVHKVALNAYHIGFNGGAHQLVVVSYKDNGVDETIGVDFPFKDDFSWLDPYIALANGALPAANQISDSVGDVLTSADGAANIYTTLANNGLDVLGELRSRGYVDWNPGMQTIYMQDAYFKFGATDKQSGLTLPLMKMEGEQDIAVSFKWCCHLSGALNVDDVKLVVEIEGPGTVVTASGASDAKVSDHIISTQEKGQMFWMDAMVKINGATSGTFISIHPDPIGKEKGDVAGVHRYYLDDISVMPAADLVPANMEVTGVEDNVITFEGTPESPATFKVLSDRVFTVESDVKWLSFDITEGPADITTEVTVTCEPSELSELRRGVITVKSGTSTHKIQVIQSAAGMELSPFISLVGGNSGNVNFDAGSFTLGVQANVEYEYSSDASWVTVEALPASKAMVEMTELAVNYEANAIPEQRIAHIRVYNASENVESVYTLTQAPFESGVYFQDDFSWVAPWADAYGSEDSVADDNASGKAPNVYTQASHQDYDGVGYANGGSGVEGYPSFVTEFADRGYVDVGYRDYGYEALYTQKYYLKLGKGSAHVGITLPSCEFEGAIPSDVLLSFDWSAHMTGKGAIDKLNLVVEIEGDGVVAATGEKLSQEIAPVQDAGDLKWQNVKVYLTGVTNATRITIRPTVMDDSDGVKQKRWYIDNIKLAKPEPVVLAKWDLSEAGMSSYVDTFGSLEGTVDATAGDGGLYVTANAGGSGKLTYVQIDKTTIDVNGKAARQVGKTGEPYVIGSWPGDYWLFTSDASLPAGAVVSASYASRASGTGMKYWLVEYFDGAEWHPAMPTSTIELNGETVVYNVDHNNTDVFNVNFTCVTSAELSGFQIRQTCVANAQASGKGALEAPNGGTVRIKGAELSPVITAVY